MTQLRSRMMHDLKLAGYVRTTQQKYINAIRAFAEFHGRSPAKLDQEEVRQWVEHLTADGKLSQSSFPSTYSKRPGTVGQVERSCGSK